MSLNTTVLMSGTDYFSNRAAINPFMHKGEIINLEKARSEHETIRKSLERAGVKVIKVDPPVDCQDGAYTANWALVRDDKAVLASLPNARKGEEAYAEQTLEKLGKTVYKIPEGLKFSGQGDALPVGKYLLCGSGYRSDPEAQKFAAETLGYERVQLQTIPELDKNNKPMINHDSGWPDSFFYDIDLAISILRDDLIAWCPDAFVKESRSKIRSLPLDQIEVSLDEAVKHFACNLVSTGETVVMSGSAPELKANIKAKGLKTITPEITELVKGGGYIRCTTLTLDN